MTFVTPSLFYVNRMTFYEQPKANLNIHKDKFILFTFFK